MLSQSIENKHEMPSRHYCWNGHVLKYEDNITTYVFILYMYYTWFEISFLGVQEIICITKRGISGVAEIITTVLF